MEGFRKIRLNNLENLKFCTELLRIRVPNLENLKFCTKEAKAPKTIGLDWIELDRIELVNLTAN